MSGRRRRNLIDSVLVRSTSEVCILDSDGRIRYFSPGMETATGWQASEVEGLICQPSVSSKAGTLDLLASGLAPGPDVFDGRTVTVQGVLPKANGSPWKTVLTFLPILGEDAQLVRVLISANEGAAVPPVRDSMTQRLHAEITAIRLKTRRRFSEVSYIGQCGAVQRALDQADLLKNSDVGYCITGPSGSGRRHLAGLVHVGGQHAEHSFVCLESRLLTQEQAQATLRELQRVADGQPRTAHQKTGTLVLLDADFCPREIQSWLLKNLTTEQREIRLVGITERPLSAAASEGWLRPEFVDALSAVQIHLPSLHHREGDLEILAQHFVQESRRLQKTSAEGISSAVLAQFQQYRWPGNIRELKQVVFDSCEACFDRTIRSEHLPFSFRTGTEAQQMPRPVEAAEVSLEAILHNFESNLIQKTLDACDGNKADAARRLGLTRPKLYRRLKSLGLDTDDSE